MTVDVQDLDCDFYAFSGHKMFGPTGIGVLYGKRGAARSHASLPGRRRHDPGSQLPRTTFNELPYKFEAGTPNICGVIGFGAAARYLEELGLHNVEA